MLSYHVSKTTKMSLNNNNNNAFIFHIVFLDKKTYVELLQLDAAQRQHKRTKTSKSKGWRHDGS